MTAQLQYRWRYAIGSGRPHLLMRNELLDTVSVYWIDNKSVFRVFTKYTRKPQLSQLQPRLDGYDIPGHPARRLHQLWRWRCHWPCHQQPGRWEAKESRYDFDDLGDAIRFVRIHLNELVSNRHIEGVSP